MRIDLENLRSQAEKQLQNPESLSSMEKRLQLCMNEVARLRTERRKLMDLNNELRAELQQARNAFLSSKTDVSEKIANASISAQEPNAVTNNPIDGNESSLDESQTEIIPYFGAPPLNSARATPSQLRALERIKKKNRALMVLAQKPPRRIMNYANASSD